jgi:plastocyanin
LFTGCFAGAQTTFTYNCILRSNVQKDTLCDGRVLPVFGITSSLGSPAKIPAKILYCNEGDSVVLVARSISQNEHHTIHLHGLDVDTRNDGDPSTSFWLSHMQDTTYSFRAKYAGTYLYHCHAADVVHVQMGMYGMIVVRAAGGAKNAWTGGPAFNSDRKWLMSEVDSVWHYHVPVHDTLMDTLRIPKYEPQYFLINGKCGSEVSSDDSISIKGSVGEKILMRMANIGYLANRIIFPSWLNAQIIDSDGRPLPSAIVNDTCFMMPGERFSVMLQPATQNSAFVNVSYLDMNSGAAVFTNNVPVTITGVFGINEARKQEAGFSLFPNPADHLLYFTFEDNGATAYTVKIFNMLGQKVLEQNNSGQGPLNISQLAPGIYYAAVFDENSRKRGSASFIKQP